MSKRSPMTELALVLTSINCEKKAHEMASQLVESCLAACVQVSARGSSFYRWKGKVEHDREYYLTIKASVQQLEKVEAWIETYHHYETPEIIKLDATAGKAYAAWLDQQLETAEQSTCC
ncbi:MAG: divalent-cation tolerance protein CutA [Mariprofundaceae bacterium]